MIAPTQCPTASPCPTALARPGQSSRPRRDRPWRRHLRLSTDSTYLPGEGIFVAVLTNSDDPATSPGIATARLAALALGDPYADLEPVEVAPATIEPLLGTYKVEGEGPERSSSLAMARSTPVEARLRSRRSSPPRRPFLLRPEQPDLVLVRRDAAALMSWRCTQGATIWPKSVRTGRCRRSPRRSGAARHARELCRQICARPDKRDHRFPGGQDALSIELGRQGVKRLRATSATSSRSKASPPASSSPAADRRRADPPPGPRQMVATRVP